ncbi:MAG: haloacid dehalogenase-like hydrolase [Candidatus Omnitrophica bacterium ADurb.Bin292]|jgi:2-hydroxy-3-keto-5-methylthiopentenyl-1-phosphate phosphatase|nr:MAG: haloacid dehalogenase-like hydrolase [Candidatus Omnitrophica bacterium ADurb.Bin292]HOG23943.1 haloacid dehalogenase-like hydrolase [Candidatus Omnitrophota bacterium]HPW76811.1 haloacid dehalogenase-like hydrolase [Candidatus Omnitrophota bacterium]
MKKKSAKDLQNIIAIVYDFDGTLAPGNMQEETIFREYGIDKRKFWAKSRALVRQKGYESTLAYLRLLISDPVFKERPLDRKTLKRLARQLPYYPGVAQGYFRQLTSFMNKIPEVREWGITVEHYIISSGLSELLDGASIRKHFKKIYACEYDYENGRPVFPKLVINDTNKTQFLFRINKGKLELSESINQHMPAGKRRIPFANMIYIGDGVTDVPSMTVMNKSGGHAIAVYDPNEKVPREVKKMIAEKRAEHFAPADFRRGSLLIKILHRTLKQIIHSISFRLSSRRSSDWVRRHW